MGIFAGQDRIRVGQHLETLRGYAPDLEFRLELVSRNEGGQFRLDPALAEPLAEMAAKAAKNSKTGVLPAAVVEAYEFFGIHVPDAAAGVQSPDEPGAVLERGKPHVPKTPKTPKSKTGKGAKATKATAETKAPASPAPSTPPTP